MADEKYHVDSNSDHSPSLGDRKSSIKEDPTGVLNIVADPDAELSEEERHRLNKKLTWKIDLYLIPWLCLLYLMSFLDRTNIGNAKIVGLQTDLKMTNNQYNLTLTVRNSAAILTKSS